VSRVLALLAVLAIALSGCSLGGGGDDKDSQAKKPTATATGPEAPPGRRLHGEPPEAAAIRGWSRQLNEGHFEQAASFFARNAIVQQGDVIRLRDRKAAVAFNESLPCHADVTDVQREGHSIVAAFQLRPGKGPRTSCDSSARVRFRFAHGKFTEWRQLMDPGTPSDGDTLQS
jgi:hypothetical protein